MTMSYPFSVWERYALTITEVSKYYHIGENKLRMITDEHLNADFIIMNGN
jgi:Excisionase from transposon Tn916.